MLHLLETNPVRAHLRVYLLILLTIPLEQCKHCYDLISLCAMWVHSGIIVINSEISSALLTFFDLKKIMMFFTIITDVFDVIVVPIIFIIGYNHIEHVFVEILESYVENTVVLGLVIEIAF